MAAVSSPPKKLERLELRFNVVRAARSWIDTPYHHQQSVKAVGCDCLGLIRGVWREVKGAEPETPPAYTRDWAEAAGEETLLAACHRWLIPIDPAEGSAGDVVVWRMLPGAKAKHCGILGPDDKVIHAREGIGVTEQSVLEFVRGFRKARVAGVFAFPGA